MKKIISLLCLSLAFAACTKTTEPVKQPVDGDSFDGYVEIDNSKKLTWEAIERNYGFSLYKDISKASDYRVVLYAPEVKQDNEESCANGYFIGDFTLGVMDKDGVVVSSVNLGELEVAPGGLYVDSFISSVPSEKDSDFHFALVESYGSCNNDTFMVYYLDQVAAEFKPVNFGESGANELYAAELKDILFDLNTVTVKSYDNSTAKWVEQSYKWDDQALEFKNV